MHQAKGGRQQTLLCLLLSALPLTLLHHTHGCARAAGAGADGRKALHATYLITDMLTPCGNADSPGLRPISSSSSLQTAPQHAVIADTPHPMINVSLVASREGRQASRERGPHAGEMQREIACLWYLIRTSCESEPLLELLSVSELPMLRGEKVLCVYDGETTL